MSNRSLLVLGTVCVFAAFLIGYGAFRLYAYVTPYVV